MKANVFMAACVLDALVGDPPWFPHPVRAIGAAITVGERLLRRVLPADAASEWRAGALLTVAVAAAACAMAEGAPARARRWKGPIAGAVVETLLAWNALAIRDLLDEARGVMDGLGVGDRACARARLSRIVGRDTAQLDTPDIARAVIETLAESACDGVIAPIFYLAAGGVRCAWAYKAINTLDSMIGHIEPPYTYFGRFAARADDLANWVPARLTALAISLSAAMLGGDGRSALRIAVRDGGRHRSPNAGWCEAAMAGALRVRLGGRSSYDGVPAELPTLGSEFNAPSAADVQVAMRIVAGASLIVSIVAYGALLLAYR